MYLEDELPVREVNVSKCPFPDKKCEECPFHQLRYAWTEDKKRTTDPDAKYWACVWNEEIKVAYMKHREAGRSCSEPCRNGRGCLPDGDECSDHPRG